MRISDWSSDVCSSDLLLRSAGRLHDAIEGQERLNGELHGSADRSPHRFSAVSVNFGRWSSRSVPAQARNACSDGHRSCGCVLSRAPVLVGGRRRGNMEGWTTRSEEHTSELQSLMRISYAVFC